MPSKGSAPICHGLLGRRLWLHDSPRDAPVRSAQTSFTQRVDRVVDQPVDRFTLSTNELVFD